jgi:hypothetical protein
MADNFVQILKRGSLSERLRQSCAGISRIQRVRQRENRDTSYQLSMFPPKFEGGPDPAPKEPLP